MKIDNKEVKIESYDIFTYRRIRRAIGYIGISLPILLIVLSLISFFQTTVQHSISHCCWFIFDLLQRPWESLIFEKRQPADQHFRTYGYGRCTFSNKS
jgi:hypothetical protein